MKRAVAEVGGGGIHGWMDEVRKFMEENVWCGARM